jgi:hypothetical protein
MRPLNNRGSAASVWRCSGAGAAFFQSAGFRQIGLSRNAVRGTGRAHKLGGCLSGGDARADRGNVDPADKGEGE